ncbi:MAG: aminotransferase class III-fold pyridoxal phosphate-dependent enzyme [Myxococcaceae bacterium]
MIDYDALVESQRQHLFYPWSAQSKAKPLCVQSAQGVWLTLNTGQKILDFNSSIFNANLGHGHAGIATAMQKAALDPKVGHPALVHPEKAKLGENLARIASGDLNKTFLTLGGAEANENAIKIARLVTGRHKVVTRYRSYHGATLATIGYSGDYRRIPFDGTVTGVVRFPDPYPRGSGQHIDTVRLLEEIIEIEGPETIACILLEGITGANGVFVPDADYWPRIRALCDKHGILLISDEVLSGFGRTGKWFAVDHFGVVPDIMTLGKGLAAGYAPLAGVMVSDKIAAKFGNETLWCGLTHYAHPFCCAVANAAIEAYESESLVENARVRGLELKAGLEAMQTKNPKIAEVRSIGLLAAIDLENFVSYRAKGKELEKASKLSDALWEAGVYCTVRFGMLVIAPPLCITSAELSEGLERIALVLSQIND